MISADEIVQLLDELRKQRHPLINEAEQVLNVYENRIVLPMPETDKVDYPTVANLTFQGIDAGGQQVSSQMFVNRFLAQTDNELGRKRARRKKGAIEYWQDESDVELGLGILARWFLAYGAANVMVKPNMKTGCPEYCNLDPLQSFPSGNDTCCDLAIMIRRKTRRWVDRHYPDTAQRLWGREARPTDVIELIDYVDDTEFVTVGRITLDVLNPYASRSHEPVVLNRAPNLAGRCTVYAIGRPGLAGPKSQFAGVIGLYIQRAMLQAYNLIGIRKSVMPEKWAMSGDANITPEIIDTADPIRGVIGVVAGGQIVQMLPQPSTLVAMTQDRLERDERVQARIPAEWGGESVSNVRTGRRGADIMGATIDLPVYEAHLHMAELFEEANKGAIAIDKAFWGGTTKTFYMAAGMAEEKVTYDPMELWDNDRHEVVYSAPGMDTAGMAVELGQRVGMEVLSKREFMELDPYNRDPERTHDLIQFEGLERALLLSLEQQATAGALPAVDLARIMQRVVTDREELTDAVVAQQQEAQARQAQQVPPTAPAAQLGLAPPGQGAEAAVAPPPQALGNVGQLLQQLQLGRR